MMDIDKDIRAAIDQAVKALRDANIDHVLVCKFRDEQLSAGQPNTMVSTDMHPQLVANLLATIANAFHDGEVEKAN